jgi:transcriptional regulator with XRE-family HTH domain
MDKLQQDQELARRSLRRLRTENKMSLAAVGLLLGVHKSHVLRMEKGTRGTPPLAAIANAFEVREWEVKASCHKCFYLPPEGFTCQNCGCDEPLSLTENVKTINVVFSAPGIVNSTTSRNLRIPADLDEYSEAGTVDYLLERAVQGGFLVEVSGYKYCN